MRLASMPPAKMMTNVATLPATRTRRRAASRREPGAGTQMKDAETTETAVWALKTKLVPMPMSHLDVCGQPAVHKEFHPSHGIVPMTPNVAEPPATKMVNAASNQETQRRLAKH